MAIRQHNLLMKSNGQNQKIIKRIVFHSSIWTFNGMDFHEVAKRFYLAYQSLISPPTKPETLEDEEFLKEKEDLLRIESTKTDEEKELEFLDKLMDGSIVSRGYVNNFQFEYLIWLLQQEDENKSELQLAAAQVLAHLSSKNERNVRNRLGDAFSKLLEFASSGFIELHTTIENSDLVLREEDLIASGAEAKVYKATWRDRTVAVKKFHEGALEFKPDEIRTEIAIMSLLHHENVRHLFFFFHYFLFQYFSSPSSCFLFIPSFFYILD